MQPQAGDLFLITVRASIQFVACEPFLFRVIRPLPWSTYQGWLWMEGYQLNAAGDAVMRRSIFVQLSGLTYAYRPAVRSRARYHEPTTHYPNTRPAAGRTRPRTYSDVDADR